MAGFQWRGFSGGVSVTGSHLLLLFQARAAFLSQELREKTPLQHGCILVGADNGDLHNERGGARHREKVGWFHPSPLPGLPAPVAASVVNARHAGQLLPRAGGSVRKAGIRPTNGECGCGRQVHGVLEGVPSAPCRMLDAYKKRSIFPLLRPGGNECTWAPFVGNVLDQTIAHKTVWARNSSKMARFGQDFDPCPNFGLGKRPGGAFFSRPKI
jgi:hypothetical protein